MTACEKAAKNDSLDEVTDAAESMRESALKELDEGGGLSFENPIDQSPLLDALDKAGDKASGQEKLAIRLAKTVMTRMGEMGEKLNEVSGNLTAGTDYSTVESEEDMEILSEKIRNYRRVNAELKKGFSMAFIDDMKKEADRIGLKGTDKVEFFNGMEPKFRLQIPVVHEIRDLDDMLCATILEQHEILRDHIDEWQWISDKGLIHFENEELAEKYNLLVDRIQTHANEQAEAQRKLLSIR